MTKTEYQKLYPILRDEFIAHLFVEGNRFANAAYNNVFQEFEAHEPTELGTDYKNLSNNGYFKRCYDAFWYALTEVKERIQAKDIVEINKIIMGAESSLQRDGKNWGGVSYHLTASTTSLRGIARMLELWDTSIYNIVQEDGATFSLNGIQLYKPFFYCETEEFEQIGFEHFTQLDEDNMTILSNLIKDGKMSWHAPESFGGDVDAFCKLIECRLDTYYKDLQNSHGTELKLLNICHLICILEQLHPFSNGNCRTFCMILLNKLLIENNFGPILQNDPNKFDSYTADQMVVEVLNSQRKRIYFEDQYKKQPEEAHYALNKIYTFDYYYDLSTENHLAGYPIGPSSLDFEISLTFYPLPDGNYIKKKI